MLCPKCGSRLPDDAAFCATCGAQVASMVSETNAREAADRVDARTGSTRKGAMFQLRAAIDEIRSDGGSEDVSVQDEPISVKGYGKTLAILSGLAAVVVAAAAVYFAMYAPYSIDERV
ncbi:MAG: zinc ribbon domain-containing protein, partial [Eggerthellaceae bacterium]|nr:zinc ribbon domain-containing protein [Eggerthellaceae bacterium]